MFSEYSFVCGQSVGLLSAGQNGKCLFFLPPTTGYQGFTWICFLSTGFPGSSGLLASIGKEHRAEPSQFHG